jgi:hypothetical protein
MEKRRRRRPEKLVRNSRAAKTGRGGKIDTRIRRSPCLGRCLEHEANDILRRELDSERCPKLVNAGRVTAIYSCTCVVF